MMDRHGMAEKAMLKGIGRKLREQSREIVDAKLPDRLRKLADRLACLEKRGELDNGNSIH
jgi:hypothetical protein